MKKSLIMICIAIFLATVLAIIGQSLDNQCGKTNEQLPVEGSVVTSRGDEIAIRVADSGCERELGLSGFPGLSMDEGMLFVFDRDDKHGFWMKDMQFSIDIVWITSDGIVTDTVTLSPETYPTVVLPHEPVRYALELPAHSAVRYDIHSSSVLKFNFNK